MGEYYRRSGAQEENAFSIPDFVNFVTGNEKGRLDGNSVSTTLYIQYGKFGGSTGPRFADLFSPRFQIGN
jgi:hypothetical protein